MKGKILYIHQYFKTQEEGGAVRSYYLAKGLVDHGYDVELITAHNNKEYKRKVIEGIIVHYLPVHYKNSFGFFRRVYAFLLFIFSALKLARQISSIDYCYASSTPLTVGLIALWLKKSKNIPYIFEVRDLWPEAPIQMGVIKNPLLKIFLKYLEKKIYREADKIVALSPGIRDGIVKLVPNKKVSLIPNMADCSLFRMEQKQPGLEKKFAIHNNFVVTYFGAVGKVNHLEYFLSTAEVCQKAGFKITFLVAGKGSELPFIKKMARLKDLKNLHFLKYYNKFELKELLNVTDAVYISFAKHPVLETNSPNKFFDGLAAGKLIIVNTPGWLEEICGQHKCGFYADPENGEGFLQKIRPFLDDKGLLLNYQKNARNLAEFYFNKELQIPKLLKVLDN